MRIKSRAVHTMVVAVVFESEHGDTYDVRSSAFPDLPVQNEHDANLRWRAQQLQKIRCRATISADEHFKRLTFREATMAQSPDFP